jgi:hypothetical protein
MMKRFKLDYLLLLLLSIVLPGCQSDDPFIRIVCSEQDPPVAYACTDLQRYIGQMTGSVPETVSFSDWEKTHKPAIVITGKTAFSQYLSPEEEVGELGEEGFAIRKIVKDGKESVLLCAETPLGKANAIYGLLKELGCEFRLGSEYVPSSLPAGFPDSLIIKKPAFSTRGVLPWYNFFNSPTSWDPVDHRAFIDQLIRCCANTITFHTYDAEPFGGYEEDGIMKHAGPLKNSREGTWGTNPMKTSEFLCGTANLYHTEYFGAASTTAGLNRNEQIKREKQVLKDAFYYAKSRGLRTAFGFSATGDPTIREDRERFVKQLENVVKFYDCLDYVVLWQEETKGAQGHPLKYDTHILAQARDPQSKIVQYGKYRRDVFKRIVDEANGINPFFKRDEEGKLSRATEGARLEMYAKLAHRILARYDHTPKLVISGWGGETYLVSAEYYDGLDKVLPQNVVFSSLDHISPQPKVDEVYAVLSADRQRWPIPWLENDGDQWHPQPHVHLYESTAKNLFQSGSQGFLAIHWRTREVEMNYGYLVDFAWDTTLTAQKYFQKFSKKYQDAGLAGEVEKIMTELDNLGYRWVGGRGQNECARFTWGPGSEDKLIQLRGIKQRLDDLLPKAKEGKEYLQWTSDRIQWVMDYQEAEVKGDRAKKLLEEAKSATAEHRQELAGQVVELLSGNELAKAMHSYAKRITTRGEYGVMATINAKAGADWIKMQKEAKDLTGITDTISPVEEEFERKIIVPRHYGSVQAGKDFRIDAVVLGGGHAVMNFRTLGEKKWESQEMEVGNGWCRSAIIPAGKMESPALEYQIVVEKEDDTDMIWGPKVISVFNDQPMEGKVVVREISSTVIPDQIRVSSGKGMEVLEWPDVTQADFYEVLIDDRSQIETPVNFYPMTEKLRKGQKVTIRIVNEKGIIDEIRK